MGPWFIERVLPGIVTSALWMPVWTLALWLSHRRLRRHVDTVTEHQSEQFAEVTAAQTAELRHDRPEGTS